MSDEPISVPFNDLARYSGDLWQRAARRLTGIIDSGWVVLGANVREFEECFAEYLGEGEVIGVANGTDGLELSLRAVGVGPSSRVGLTANAGFYSAIAIRSIGADPVYFDLALGQASPGVKEVEELLERSEVAAVVVTHLYGRVVPEIAAISELCRRAGVALVEDCSQSHGARRGDRHAGTFGDVAAFSLYPTKNLGALGDGGAVYSCRPEVAAAVRSLRQYGWGNKYVVELSGGRNSRLDEIQAAVLIPALKELDNRNERRRTIVDEYVRAVPHVDFLGVDVERSAWVGHLCAIAVDERDEVRAVLEGLGVATDVHFPVPDHLQPIWTDRRRPHLPRTETLARRVLSVPCFPDMTDSEVAHVAAALRVALA